MLLDPQSRPSSASSYAGGAPDASPRIGRPHTSWSVVGHVVAGLDDALEAPRAESDEDTCREDSRPSEAVAIGRSPEKLAREQARGRQARAGPAGGPGK